MLVSAALAIICATKSGREEERGLGGRGCFSLFFGGGGGVKNLLPLHCDTYESCLKKRAGLFQAS